MAAITSGEILFKYSVAAAAGNTTPGTNLTTWQGDQISQTAWSGTVLNDLFDDVTGAENSGNVADYRCIFVHNNNGFNVLQNAVVYISGEVAGGTTISLAVDTVGVVAIGSGSAQALVATTETTGPQTSLTYSTAAVSAATGLALGNIGIAQCRAFWIKRQASNSSALTGDGVTISVTGDTGAL